MYSCSLLGFGTDTFLGDEIFGDVRTGRNYNRKVVTQASRTEILLQVMQPHVMHGLGTAVVVRHLYLHKLSSLRPYGVTVHERNVPYYSQSA